jgi:hypothetical protein
MSTMVGLEVGRDPGRIRLVASWWLSVCLAGVALAGCRALVGIDDREAERDGGVADAAQDAATDAANDAKDGGVDVQVGDACEDDCYCPEVDSSDDVTMDGPESFDCIVWETVAIPADVVSGPRMERLDGGWAMVAVGAQHESIWFDVLQDVGVVAHGVASSLIGPGGNWTYRTPMMAVAGARVVLGVARPADPAPEPWGADFYSLDPWAATFSAGPETVSTGPTVPVVVSGLAVAPGLNRVVAVTRDAPNAGMTGSAKASLFDTTSLEQVKEVQLATAVYGGAVAWSESAQRFGVALLDDSLLTKGFLHVFDVNLENQASHRFTAAADWPMVSGGWEVSIAAVGESFAIAWADRRHDEQQHDIYVTSIHGGTGEVSLAGSVKVSGDTSVFREYPRIRFDGRSLIVAWLEQDGTFLSLRARRLTTGLEPIGHVLTIDPEAEVFQGPFGMAVAAENDYGFVSARGDGHFLFARLVCTGP